MARRAGLDAEDLVQDVLVDFLASGQRRVHTAASAEAYLRRAVRLLFRSQQGWLQRHPLLSLEALEAVGREFEGFVTPY